MRKTGKIGIRELAFKFFLFGTIGTAAAYWKTNSPTTCLLFAAAFAIVSVDFILIAHYSNNFQKKNSKLLLLLKYPLIVLAFAVLIKLAGKSIFAIISGATWAVFALAVIAVGLMKKHA